jgi:hypothetical protein
VFEQAALSAKQMPIRRTIVWRLQPLACRWRFLCEAHPGHYEVRAGAALGCSGYQFALFFACLWPCWDLRLCLELVPDVVVTASRAKLALSDMP